MKQQLVTAIVPLALFALAATGMEKGHISETKLKGLHVAKIRFSPTDRKATVSLTDCQGPCPGPIVIPGEKPGGPVKRSAHHKVELDLADAADSAIFQIFLKAYGGWSTVNLTLDKGGNLTGVELAGGTSIGGPVAVGPYQR